ncbi:MAG: tRNA lysidine(34) synthetase TilS, partial [Trueperaceae bacterium]|nr:tRNA lysidine(34) synthetase TilS [Trueperaceae bacterium]
MNATRGVDDQLRAALDRLAPDARRVLVALSGGSDSVAVLRALVDAPDRDVVAAHLDHRLRATSGDDAAWVQATCARLGVPLESDAVDVHAVHADKGGNLEAVAREVRYAFLTRAAKAHACDVVVTAHTRDDQAETVLLQLLRGTAHPRGIEPRRGPIVRPALALGKADLRGWLDGLGQDWREDADNRDRRRDRAWLRHEVLPVLQRRRPGSAARLARFADLQRDQAAFFAMEADRRFRRDAPARAVLAAAPTALQREVLARLVRDAGGDVDVAHLDAALAALPGHDAWRADLPGGVRLRFGRNRVDALPPPEATPAPPTERDVATPDALPDGAPPTLLEDGPWRLRTPRPGDRIR